MDHLSGGGRSPRKELLGPRPPPLKVKKEPFKVKKPPMAPPANQPPPPHQPPRQPVIIYTVSPKVIHTNPSEFMTLVQRLTGPDVSTSSSTAHHASGAMVSPAARFASIEKTKMPLEGKRLASPSEVVIVDGEVGVGGEVGVEKTVFFQGVLSPGPGSLPPISPNLFSPFFHEPSGVNLQQHGINRSYMEGNYNMASPFSTNFMSPSTMFSPSSLDFLHQILNN